ncbi:hypothetical protein GPEL0_01r5371 [Geoanaerobacter pelophilus]|uniref:Secreted protein n=1 Tax=Geoanaerobacter pelophilus TaxID=60036 RepID=A0ABQ0MP61_9BACT|nr:hypothetical protein GPEL0_01r5371 [Geoanaerobacter pelophilus]
MPGAGHLRPVALGAAVGRAPCMGLVVAPKRAALRIALPRQRIERRHGMAIVAFKIVLRRGQRQRCSEHHNTEQHQSKDRSEVAISMSAVALHFKLLL